MLHFQNNGARGVCTIFAIFFGHCDGVTAFSYALFDAAAMIRRQLSTILLETCTPGTSVSSLSPLLPSSSLASLTSGFLQPLAKMVKSLLKLFISFYCNLDI